MANNLDFDHNTELAGIPEQASLLSSNQELLAGVRTTRAQFARMMGCSRQAVTEWVKAGRLTVGADGRFDPCKAVADLLRTGDPARLRARVLKPLAVELQNHRARIVDLEAALGQAMRTIETERRNFGKRVSEEIEFHEGATLELLNILDALEDQLGDAWPDLVAMPENGGRDIIIGWLKAARMDGATPGPLLPAQLDLEEGGAESAWTPSDICHQDQPL